MTLCPIAILSSCKKCPFFSICPLKGIIGDYKKKDDSRIARDGNDKDAD